MAVQWLTPDEQRAWRAYVRTGTLLTARLNRQLQADSGLSLPEYEVLVRLSEAPGGRLRPFQLGRALDWEQSRLSHLLARMTRRGFVVRQDCPGDRRGALVVLTGAGRAAIESAAPGHVAAVRRLVFDQMDSAQAAAFGQAFEAILTALDDDCQRLSSSAAQPLSRMSRFRASFGCSPGPGASSATRLAHVFHDAEIIAVDSSFMVDPGNYRCHNTPRKPDPPRYWDGSDGWAERGSATGSGALPGPDGRPETQDRFTRPPRAQTGSPVTS